MQHLVMTAPGQLDWLDAEDPAPADDGVVVRPLAVARCDLDLAMAHGIFPAPIAVGHEIAAEVVATGSATSRWAVGDQVVLPFQVSCGTCPTCLTGRFAGCESVSARAGAAFGFGGSGGGFGGGVADLLAVPWADHLLEPLPAGMDPVVACTVPDNVVDAWRAVAPQLAATPGADVLVVGGLAASIGLYAVAVAVALGAGSVRYVDPDPGRVELARSLGASAEVVATWPRRFDRARIVVENTGTEDGLHCAIRSTAPYGHLTAVAIQFQPTTPIPMLEMYTRGITLHTSRADSRRHLAEVLGLVASGTIDPSPVTTSVVGRAEAAAAWLQPMTKLVVDLR